MSQTNQSNSTESAVGSTTNQSPSTEPTAEISGWLSNQVTMPAVSADEALRAWQAHQDLMTKIIDPKQDILVIRGQEFKKKSYWRKVAAFFNLSIETKSEWKEQLGKTMVWHFTIRASAPNGRFIDGVGSCDVFEKASLREGSYQTFNSYKGKWEEAVPNSPHNVRTTAYTRAFNRAVSDLIAGGELSAEEAQAAHEPYVQRQKQQTQTAPAASQSTSTTDEVPMTGRFGCEKCEQTIPLNTMLKSKERYDDHTFCFKHQLEYKKSQLVKPKISHIDQPQAFAA